jgi:hypothetical protein
MKKREFHRLSRGESFRSDGVGGSVNGSISAASGTWVGISLVDHLIDYLSEHHKSLHDRDKNLIRFEKLTEEVLNSCSEPELHSILKEQGWTGTHFQLSVEPIPPYIDGQSCLNALSNYYLKVNTQPALTEALLLGNSAGGGLSSGAGAGGGGVSAGGYNAEHDMDSHSLEQILPFCPDVLVAYLRKQPILPGSTQPRRICFTGACMLADISGFSKFSGAMCSKGVSGLDDLREATNGFLGYFVKQVYEYEGDGRCICIVHVYIYIDIIFTTSCRVHIFFFTLMIDLSKLFVSS